MSIRFWILLASWLTPCQDIISLKKGILVYLKIHFFLLSFRFHCMHICSTFSSISLWSLLCSSNLAIKISLTMPKIVGLPLNSSSIFFWNISPATAAPNCSLVYWYLPNRHENVVKYDNLSLNFNYDIPNSCLLSSGLSHLLNQGITSFNIKPL